MNKKKTNLCLRVRCCYLNSIFRRKITFPHKFRIVFRAVDHSIVFYRIWLGFFFWCFILPTCISFIRCVFLRAQPSSLSLPLVAILYFVHTTKEKNGINLYPSVIRRAIVELHSTCVNIMCICCFGKPWTWFAPSLFVY